MKLDLTLDLERVKEDKLILKKCIGVCRLNVNSICVGCKRTIDEIKQAGETIT